MGESTLYKIIGIILALSIVITILTANIVSITATTLLKSDSSVIGSRVQAPATTDAIQAGETVLESPETLPNETAQVEGTEGTNQTTGSSGNTNTTKSSGNTNTTKKAGSTQKNNAEIVTIYNNSVNNTKKYQGTVKIKRTQGTTTTILAISPESVRGKAEELLPNDWPKEKSGTYTKGVNAEGDSITRMLPPDKQTYGSKLTVAGVKSANYTAVGSGSKVVITLIEEKGDDINFVPPHHASCMDTLSITSEDLKPFTLKKASIIYTGATITAEINSKGLITSLKINEPAKIQGNLSLSFIPLINADIEGVWRQEFVLTY